MVLPSTVGFTLQMLRIVVQPVADGSAMKNL